MTLRLVLDVDDATLRETVLAAGARIGVEVVLDSGGRPLRLPPLGTIAHALRVEALCELSGPLSLHASSRRARRLLSAHTKGASGAGSVLREDPAGRIAFVAKNHAPIDLGEPPEAEAAIREAQARSASPAPSSDVVVPVDAVDRARAIVFGPPRTLSEPSSRRVLEAFGVRSPPWRLAEDAARAAVHARAVGYPVDLRVASPDVSAIDDAALCASELRTPGEVREAFRSIARETKRHVASARVLGVTVARRLAPNPRVRLRLDLAEGAEAKMEIALDDPIGSKLTRPLAFVPPLETRDAASLLAHFEGKNALPEHDVPRGRELLELLVRVARLASALSGSLERAELVGVAPLADDAGWGVGGARLRVRGADQGD